jgi:hypothetical protein
VRSSGVLRQAQDERRDAEKILDFPFVLSLSKHEFPFFSSQLG